MVYDFTCSLVGISQEHVGNVESPIPCISQGSPGKPASQVVQWVKKLPAMQVTQEMQIWTLVWADPLEEGLATHATIPAWRIPMERGAWWATVPWAAKSQTASLNGLAFLLKLSWGKGHVWTIVVFLTLLPQHLSLWSTFKFINLNQIKWWAFSPLSAVISYMVQSKYEEVTCDGKKHLFSEEA